MIFDKHLTVSAKQNVLATAYSIDTIDLGQSPHCAELQFVVVVSSESGTNPTLTVELQHSTDNSTFTVATALVKPTGKRTFSCAIGNLKLNRYVRTRYVVGGASPDYTITAGLVAGVQDWTAVADSAHIA